MMGQNWGNRASLTGRQVPLPHLKAHKRDNTSRSQSRPLPKHRPQGIVTRGAETQRSWGSGSAASRARSPARRGCGIKYLQTLPILLPALPIPQQSWRG